jgi:hypothetical protein
MDKGIGFNRVITLDWLDAIASLCLEKVSYSTLRDELVQITKERLTGEVSQRKTIDILTAIWVRIDNQYILGLRDQALQLFQMTTSSEDRLWLHYGMTLVTYPFFRLCVSEIGKMGRVDGEFSNQALKSRVSGEIGNLGAVSRSVRYIVQSLKEWGLLLPGNEKGNYSVQKNIFRASSINLEIWLLACALYAHPSTQLPFPDLIRLAELFSFRFTVSTDHLRNSSLFDIDLQGGGLEMVRLIVE